MGPLPRGLRPQCRPRRRVRPGGKRRLRDQDVGRSVRVVPVGPEGATHGRAPRTPSPPTVHNLYRGSHSSLRRPRHLVDGSRPRTPVSSTTRYTIIERSPFGTFENDQSTLVVDVGMSIMHRVSSSWQGPSSNLFVLPGVVTTTVSDPHAKEESSLGRKEGCRWSHLFPLTEPPRCDSDEVLSSKSMCPLSVRVLDTDMDWFRRSRGMKLQDLFT